MNDLLSTLGHSAIWASVRVLVRDHPSWAAGVICLGALLLLARWASPTSVVIRQARRARRAVR